MSTERELQHFVPKFYLRYFSYENNKRQIGVFNILSETFAQRAKLKTQCGKPFYYGKDGKLENTLSKIESDAAPIFQKIIDTSKLPLSSTDDFKGILEFIMLIDSRNPVHERKIIESNRHMEYQINQLSSSKKSKIIHEIPKISHEDAIKLMFTTLEASIGMCRDLDCKLVLNNTSIPFITSDFPLVKYNQYYEGKKAIRGANGLGSLGIQLLFPLSPTLLIMFYDRSTYKVGDKKKHFISIIKDSEIQQLNLLQILNCENNILFNDKISQSYVLQLLKQSKLFLKANATQSSVLERMDGNGNIMKNNEVIMLSSTVINVNLKIDQISLIKRAKSREFDIGKAQMRQKAMNSYFQNRTDMKFYN